MDELRIRDRILLMRRFTLALAFSAVLATTGVPRQQGGSKPPAVGSIEGIVLEGNGKPLSGATVYALPENDMTKQFHTITGDAGKFILDGLPEGGAYLSAFKERDGYPYNFFSFFLSPGEKTPRVNVRAGEIIKGVTIQLGQRSARLNLEITDQNGKLLNEGVELTFRRPDLPGDYSRGANTEESLLVPPVPFRLTVGVKGYKPWHILLSLKPEETRSLSIRLALVE